MSDSLLVFIVTFVVPLVFVVWLSYDPLERFTRNSQRRADNEAQREWDDWQNEHK